MTNYVIRLTNHTTLEILEWHITAADRKSAIAQTNWRSKVRDMGWQYHTLSLTADSEPAEG